MSDCVGRIFPNYRQQYPKFLDTGYRKNEKIELRISIHPYVPAKNEKLATVLHLYSPIFQPWQTASSNRVNITPSLLSWIDSCFVTARREYHKKLQLVKLYNQKRTKYSPGIMVPLLLYAANHFLEWWLSPLFFFNFLQKKINHLTHWKT